MISIGILTITFYSRAHATFSPPESQTNPLKTTLRTFNTATRSSTFLSLTGSSSVICGLEKVCVKVKVNRTDSVLTSSRQQPFPKLPDR